MTSSGRLSVGIIGAGPVGVMVGKALAAAGHELVGISAISKQNVERVEALLPDVELRDVDDIISEADLVLLAIPADELISAVAGFAEAKLWRQGQLVVHTAGEFGYSALSPASAQGVIPIAIHPAMRFTGTSIDLNQMRESFFAVSAPNVALPIAEALVLEMGGEPVVVAETNRAAYWEAYSVASNFSAMVVSQAIGLLEEIGVKDPRSVVAPIVRSAVEQALAAGYTPIDPEDLLP